MISQHQPYLLIAASTVMGAVSIATLPAASPGWVAAGTAAGGVLAWRIAGTRNVLRILKGAAFLGPFILFLAVMEFFRGDNQEVVSLAGIDLPVPLIRAVSLLLKTFTAVGLGLAWGDRVGAHGIARSLHRVRAPAAAVATTFLATNFLSTLAREWDGVRMAAQARGLSRARYAFRVRQLCGSLMSVLVRSLWRGDRIGWAMRARGYTGRLPEPLIKRGAVPLADFLLPILAVAVVAIAVCSRTMQ